MVRTMLVSTLLALSVLATAPARADAYDDTVNKKIIGVVEYPRLAKMRQLEGKVGFSIKIDPSGEIVDATVDSSSGQTSLDNAALEAVKKAAPFPAPAGGARTVHGVINYQLS